MGTAREGAELGLAETLALGQNRRSSNEESA